MHIVIAPDSFKGSLSASEVATALGEGIAEAFPDARISLLPLSDGGEGFIEALAGPLGAELHIASVHDPLGRPVDARFGYVAARATGLIEVAEASGLQLLGTGERDALRASSFGTGELVAAALDAGARRLLIGLGGSATNDGGAGLASALGVRFFDAAGEPVAPGGAALVELATIDHAGLHPGLRDIELLVASDVGSPLLGPGGATALYAPQKGANPDDLVILEEALARYTTVVEQTLGVELRDEPGAGAAGGLGFGLAAFCGAKLVSGIDLVLDALDADRLFAGADLIITGEGRIDEQTMQGKVVAGVARRARRFATRVVAVAGNVDDDARSRLRKEGVLEVVSANTSPGDRAGTKERLRTIAAALDL